METRSQRPAAATSAPASADTLSTSNQLLTVIQVMARLKVCRATVQRWCKERKLPAVKIGKEYRIRESDLVGWYDGQLAEQAAERKERFGGQEQAAS